MKLYVFGGIHDNPLHRRRLKRWLECLHNQLGPPAFVAVEANRVLFQAVIKHQRLKFVNLGKGCPQLSQLNGRSLEKLSRAIAYEADTHEEAGCFAEDLPLVWLDDELQDQDLKTVNDPCGTAMRHLKRCQKALAESKTRDCDLARETPVFKAIDAYLRRDAEQPSQRTNIDGVGVPGLQLPGRFDRDDR